MYPPPQWAANIANDLQHPCLGPTYAPNIIISDGSQITEPRHPSSLWLTDSRTTGHWGGGVVLGTQYSNIPHQPTHGITIKNMPSDAGSGTMELLSFVAATQIGLTLGGDIQYGLDCKGIIQKIKKLQDQTNPPRGAVNATNGLLYRYIRRTKHKARTPKHIKGHPEKTKGKDKSQWSAPEVLNYIADKLADWSPSMQANLLKTEHINIEHVYPIDANDIITGCFRPGDFYWRNPQGHILTSPTFTRAATRRKAMKTYLATRTETSTSQQKWFCYQTRMLRQIQLSERKGHTSQRIQRMKHTWDKLPHGRNIDKAWQFNNKGQPQANAQDNTRCLLCGEEDSQGHILLQCSHQSICLKRQHLFETIYRHIDKHVNNTDVNKYLHRIIATIQSSHLDVHRRLAVWMGRPHVWDVLQWDPTQRDSTTKWSKQLLHAATKTITTIWQLLMDGAIDIWNLRCNLHHNPETTKSPCTTGLTEPNNHASTMQARHRSRRTKQTTIEQAMKIEHGTNIQNIPTGERLTTTDITRIQFVHTRTAVPQGQYSTIPLWLGQSTIQPNTRGIFLAQWVPTGTLLYAFPFNKHRATQTITPEVTPPPRSGPHYDPQLPPALQHMQKTTGNFRSNVHILPLTEKQLWCLVTTEPLYGIAELLLPPNLPVETEPSHNIETGLNIQSNDRAQIIYIGQ